MYRKLIKSLIVSACVALTTVAYGSSCKQKIINETDDTLVCFDFFGQKTVLPKRPQRVVIGYTSMVNVWYMAGGKALAIPSNREMLDKNLPPAARNLPRLGSFANLNIEKIIALKPDLVILSAFSGSCRAGGKAALLNAAGIKTLSLYYGNYSGFIDLLDIFCRLNGNSIDQNKTAKEITEKVQKVIAKTAKLKSPRFLSIFYSGKGLSVELNRAYTAQIAKMLNATNIAQKFGNKRLGSRIPFSMEKLVLEDPDVILFTTMGDSKKYQARLKKSILANPAWQNMRAVKQGNVHFLPNNLFLYKANERYPQAFKYLAALLYPKQNFENK